MISSAAIGREPWLWFWQRSCRRTQEALQRFPRYLAQKPMGVIRRLNRLWTGQTVPKVTSAAKASQEPANLQLDPGMRVRVRLRDEIERTLDIRRQYKGCPFADPMFRFCGQEFRVFKRVERFFDEAQRRMVKCKDIVLLENVFCDGMGYPESQGCDRTCFYFWRTEWLERID